MTAIKTDKLRKEYKNLCAVRDLDLEINEGEIFALLGVNGAGKTTTIKMLTGLAAPTSGDAFVFGRSVKKEPYAVKSMIDVSMQETAVARNLTVAENLEFYASLAGLSKEKAEENIKNAIDRFGFGKVMKTRAKNLSGGWQRKLSIALALLSEPRVLFLDEPTLGLDVISRRELWRLVEGLRGSMTIVLTTHYLEEAEKLSDRIGIMKEGVLLTVGSAAEIIAKTGKENFEEAFIEVVERGETL